MAGIAGLYAFRPPKLREQLFFLPGRRWACMDFFGAAYEYAAQIRVVCLDHHGGMGTLWRWACINIGRLCSIMGLSSAFRAVDI